MPRVRRSGAIHFCIEKEDEMDEETNEQVAHYTTSVLGREPDGRRVAFERLYRMTAGLPQRPRRGVPWALLAEVLTPVARDLSARALARLFGLR
jgi:hypothetical protein